MRVWKPILFAIVFALSACSPKSPAEDQPVTETASAPSPPAASEPSAPAPAPAPAAVAAPAPKKPAAPKPAANSAGNAIAPSAPAAPAPPREAAALKDIAPTPAPAPAPAPAPPPPPKPVIIPAGTELNVVLSDALNSGKSKAGDAFTASLAAPIYAEGKTILERGAKLQGQVVAAEGSGRVSGKASMKLALTGVMYKGQMAPIVTKDIAAEADSSTKRDAGAIAGGAGLGAVIGAIAGGKKGAAVGATVGGAGGTGVVLATKGKEVDFPVESKLTFTLDRELSVLP